MRCVFLTWNDGGPLPETFALSRLLPFRVGERLRLELLSNRGDVRRCTVTVRRKTRAGTILAREAPEETAQAINEHQEDEKMSSISTPNLPQNVPLTATFSASQDLTAEAETLLSQGETWIEVDREPEAAREVLLRLCVGTMGTARIAVRAVALSARRVGGRLHLLVRVTDRASQLALRHMLGAGRARGA